MSLNKPIVYSGVHFKKCPVEIRELWAKAFAKPEFSSQFQQALTRSFHLSTEFVFISTCNRFDVIGLGNELPQTEQNFVLAFQSVAVNYLKANNSWTKDWEKKLSLEKVAGYLRTFFNADAAAFLFRVCSSLDSLVVGEPHILGQVKEALQQAREKQMCGTGLGTLFSRAFQVAKRVRRETDISKNGVSIGHAAVDISKRVYDTFDESHRILVVGAGEMGRVVAQHFAANGARHITIANRSLTRATELQLTLQQQNSNSNYAVVDLASSLKRVGEFDIVVVATGSQTPLITTIGAKPSLQKRRGTPTVIVDISVPRNVEPEVSQLDNVFVFDVDDLDKIMEHNRNSRQAAAREAEKIIDNEVHAFLHELKAKQSLQSIGRLHQFVKETVLHELKRKNGSSQSLIADAVAKKLVSHAATLARGNSDVSQVLTVGDALELLFCLDNYPKLLKPIPSVEEEPTRKKEKKNETGNGTSSAKMLNIRK